MIKTVIVKDVFVTYSYFYIDDKTKHGFLIDPGAEAEKLIGLISENGWKIEKILLTHGHFDHTGAVEEIHQELKIPYLIHENGRRYLESTEWNLSRFCDRNILLREAEYYEEGDWISIGANAEFGLKVITAPGHTMDSVVLYSEEEKIAFVGDTIFKGSIGSTQYLGSEPRDLVHSIREKVFRLPDETVLYPGHSEATIVGLEKQRYM